MIWLIHLLTISLLALLSKITRSPKLFVNSVFWYSILIFGQRWMTGEDFPGYLLYYLVEFNSGFSSFFLIQNFFSSSGLYFGLFIFIIYTITLYNTFFVIKSVNKNLVITVFIYVFLDMYFQQLSQIRQQLAISFYTVAYLYLFRKEYLRAAILILISVSIHFSAFLAIPFLFIRFEFSKALGLILIAVTLVLPFINITMFLPNQIQGVYGNYIGGVYDQSLNLLHLVRYYAIVFFGIFLISASRLDKSNQIEKMIIIGFVIYIILYGLSFQFAPFLRVTYFFKIFEVICIGYFITEILVSNKQIMKLSVFVLTIGIYTSIAVLDPYNITRYQFRLLQMQEDRTVESLRGEIDDFYYKN